MITQFLRSLIAYTVFNADVESKRKWTNLHYVKSEHFPQGVYRIPLGDFLPGYMCTNSDILEELLRLCVEEYPTMIQFDVPSAWITINGNIPTVTELFGQITEKD